MAVLRGATIAWLYAGTLAGLGGEWRSSPDASYGVVLVSLAAAVAWQRRERGARAFRARSRESAGLVVLTGGLLLYLAGQLGADVFLTRVSLVAIVAGTVWFLA